MEKDSIYFQGMDDVMFLNACRRRRQEAEAHENKIGLKKIREQNIKDYLAKYVEEQLVDERYQEVYVDNRQFTSVRTLVPFLAGRVTAAEVTPANGTDLAIQFAHDFEEALQKYTEKQQGRAKMRLGIQDVLKGERVGILKLRYDGILKKIVIEHIDPRTVTIGKRGRQFEEPDYVGQDLDRSVYDLVAQFPDKEAKIKELFSITKGIPSQMEKVYTIKEEWMWVDVNKEKHLCVGWSYQNFLFGKIKDPNWNENGKNILESPMLPYVFINFLSDGKGHYDETSFMEQSHWSQKNYNKRGQTIAENAKYGGTGVPIFAKGSIAQKDVAKIRFSPIQRVLLDSPDVSKSFTVWQSTPLPNYIMEDKADLRDSIDNIWGSNAALRGQETQNKTLGQDVINRDQAEGRLADPVDCVDDSMSRLYQLLAQMFYVYNTEEQYVKYLGNDGKFVALAIHKAEIAKNLGIEISVKAGTSLPIDRAQKRATIMELLKANKVGTLTAYKELDVFEDPEAAYKEYLLEPVDPATSLQEVDKNKFNREANEDLQLVIGGKEPEEREDIGEEYGAYLQDWLETDKYMLLQQKDEEAAARVSAFVDHIIEKLSRKANKIAMQPMQQEDQQVPPEVAAIVNGQAPPGQQAPQPQPVNQ